MNLDALNKERFIIRPAQQTFANLVHPGWLGLYPGPADTAGCMINVVGLSRTVQRGQRFIQEHDYSFGTLKKGMKSSTLYIQTN